MPIYEYLCSACGFQQEYLQKMSAAPLTDCPECGKPSFGKMVTAAGFQLKGSGWYATDFKNGAQAKAKAADAPAAKSDDKPAATANAEPAAKADAKPAPEAPAKKTDAAASTASSSAGTSPAST